MTPERYKEIGQLCRTALELEPAQRAAYVVEACGDDEALRQEVESLLGYEIGDTKLLDQPALEVVARAMAAEQVGSPVGQRVGHCRILSLLGKGGMGEVWLAEDTQLSRKVAVKLLPAEFTSDVGRVRRFAQEARAASALNHPNIITIHEIGEFQTEAGATHYITTEYVEGETLRQRLSSAPQQRMKLLEALEIATQIATALNAAHEAGIVHRDIKPENVMLRRDRIVKVLDFGLAKLTEAAALSVDTPAQNLTGNSTEAGMVLGTPRYMSPEQARGEKVDSRSDLFSLGVVLYEMAAAKAPFEGVNVVDVLGAILNREPVPLTQHAPDAPDELQRIISKALRKDREERYQTAQDLLLDLKALKQELEIGARLGQPIRAGASGEIRTGGSDE